MSRNLFPTTYLVILASIAHSLTRVEIDHLVYGLARSLVLWSETKRQISYMENINPDFTKSTTPCPSFPALVPRA